MSVEKRQKEQEKTSMVVEGFLFANEAAGEKRGGGREIRQGESPDGRP